MSSYSKIFNDVFVFEKPLSVQRYYVTEVQVIELNETRDFLIRAMTPLTVNFTEGTSRSLNYGNSEEYKKFLLDAIKAVKKIDKA
jgi:hypothetical protein